MPMQNRSQYFIALIPDAELSSRITAIKQYIAATYHTKKALRVMPHITLKAPFSVLPERDNEVLAWFENIVTDVAPFEISLEGYGAFENSKSPVLFIKPVINDGLAGLQKQIITAFKNQFHDIALHFHEEQFHPHITVAYRDLDYNDFEKAWEFYAHEKFSGTFSVVAFYLLKHNGVAWNIVKHQQTPAFPKS